MATLRELYYDVSRLKAEKIRIEYETADAQRHLVQALMKGGYAEALLPNYTVLRHIVREEEKPKVQMAEVRK